MSILSIPEKARQKSLHRRTVSGELDVFEAERYFSASTDHFSQPTTITIPQRIGVMRSGHNPRQGRASLDIPARPVVNPQHQNYIKEEKKKHKKQPSSPGAKLASFFNSLISQTVSKNKKPSKPIKSDVHVAKPVRSISGFRTPPPYMINKPSYSADPKPNLDWLDEEFKFVTSSVKEVGMFDKRLQGSGLGSFKRFMEEEEDGDDSDSSSDLFELQLHYDNTHLHHKLGYSANDLPVYETTSMDTIKISCTTPITDGPFRN